MTDTGRLKPISELPLVMVEANINGALEFEMEEDARELLLDALEDLRALQAQEPTDADS